MTFGDWRDHRGVRDHRYGRGRHADGHGPRGYLLALPTALGEVAGTVSPTAVAQDYTVTITASDVVGDVTSTFTITIQENAPPVITDPGAKSYVMGEPIVAFAITVTDSDVGDTVTVTVTGLPQGLVYGSGQVSGTVAASAPAQDYTVTIEATDSHDTVTLDFTVTVLGQRAPGHHRPGGQEL